MYHLQDSQLTLVSNSAFMESHRILRMSDLVQLLQRSKSMLYLDMSPTSSHYKPNFPKPFKLSARSVGWKAKDVYAYIDSLERKG